MIKDEKEDDLDPQFEHHSLEFAGLVEEKAPSQTSSIHVWLKTGPLIQIMFRERK